MPHPRMSLGVGIMVAKAGRPPWTMERQADMTNHNGVLMMQRLLLAGTLGLAMAQKAAAILEGEPATANSRMPDPLMPVPPVLDSQQALDPRSNDGAVLRAILDAANECLGHFDDRPPGERWCDALLHLLDLAAFAADLDSAT
jgi:hypothetical protein